MNDNNGTFNEEETAHRRDQAIRRALNTPPKPHSKIVGKNARLSDKRKSTIVEKGEQKS
jgi:hypothetical protein